VPLWRGLDHEQQLVRRSLFERHCRKRTLTLLLVVTSAAYLCSSCLGRHRSHSSALASVLNMDLHLLHPQLELTKDFNLLSCTYDNLELITNEVQLAIKDHAFPKQRILPRKPNRHYCSTTFYVALQQPRLPKTLTFGPRGVHHIYSRVLGQRESFAGRCTYCHICSMVRKATIHLS
jgi:hypothetical protein